MKILIACEESQTVCNSFRKLGFDCYSCDVEPTRGNPLYHIQGDAIDQAYSGEYHLMIAHPPCTYMSRAGARWMYQNGTINEDRLKKAYKAREFFNNLLNAPINHIAIENPTPLKIIKLPDPSQIIQPYQFGNPYSKRTLLWLKNLPVLKYTKILNEYTPYLPSNKKNKKRGQKYTYKSINKRDSSVTFQGIADAMADQWGNYIKNGYEDYER